MSNFLTDAQATHRFTPAQTRRLKPLDGKQPGTLLLHEIYRSIQGESLYAGLPCLFIRFTACHLRCVYCDTPHAFLEGKTYLIDDVIELARQSPDPLVEITGGEPLLQPEVYPLMTALADLGKTVLLETSGAISIEPVDARVHVILDIKTPGSGEDSANLVENYPLLKPSDELKFVICSRSDFDWAIAHLTEHRLLDRCAVLLTPSFAQVRPEELAHWILETGLPLRLQLQLHKQLWNPSARGV